ncbi:MAG: histidine kinase [Flavobacteriales bacterium]|nr:histidine kinase [Flavobacteriales bacterium]
MVQIEPFLYRVKFLIPLFLLPLFLFAQQPAHYVLGESELEGVDIYDILQTADGAYILATSNGIIRFDGYAFANIGCPDMLMQSVFNLVEDSQGNVYCHNLSGQIFMLSNEECQLLLTLPDSLVSADMNLAIENQNRLIIGSNSLIAVDDAFEIVILTEHGSIGPITRLPNGTLFCYSSAERRFLTISNGKVKKDLTYQMTLDGYHTPAPALIVLKDSIYPYQTGSCEVYRQTNGGTELIFNPSTVTGKTQLFKLYATSNALWFASSSVGVLRVDASFNPNNGGKLLFPRTLISNVIEDKEGNVLLGTFGKGIIVIPNETTEDMAVSDRDEDVISISGSEDGRLYFGTRSGKLIERLPTGELKSIREANVKSMEALFSVGNGLLLIGETNGVLLRLQTGTESVFQVGSIKDVEQIDANEFLIASNGGAYRYHLSTGKAERIEKLQLRHYAIGYDPHTKSIFCGTSKGLMIRHSNDSVKPFRLKGQDVIVRDFISWQGQVYAATAENGLLVFSDDDLVVEINTLSGLVSNQLMAIATYQNQLVVATALGVQLLTEQGVVKRTINQADGLNALKILDMEVMGNELWVVHSAGVQKVMLDSYKPFDFVPIVTLKSVIVNDTLSPLLNLHDFNHDQQKFTFVLSTNSLRYRNEISYQYRLEGAESQWQTASFADNVIEYRSLSPGNYAFRVKAICRGVESEEIVYSFAIATPFYKAWWFYALMSFGVILILIAWFRTRLSRQQVAAQQQNELNASKLTAIQSQMNPHFIFNALNSIQSLVLKGDVDNSYTYITKFANLVRRTLNYSDKEFIDFSEEIKLIELYLTLEQLRFKEDFEFSINENEVEDVMIPPMIIQPFIENALVHGLLHRSGSKRIQLEFKLDAVLICTITDNGVGRAKAKAIKERQRAEHESFSINAIRTRFEILQRYHKGSLGFTYEDLTLNDEPTGTRVVLRIPVKRKF